MTRMSSIAFVFAGLIICVVALAWSPARAYSPEERCNDYANRAVKDVDRALKGRCKVAGPRWSTNKEEHRQWCLSLKGDQTPTNAESHARGKELRTCYEWCSKYADKAFEAARKNIDWKCGYPDGPRWSPDPDHHAIWCRWQGTREQAVAEAAARTAALAECKKARPYIEKSPIDIDKLKKQ